MHIEMNSLFAYYPVMKSIYLDWAASSPVHPEIPSLISGALLTFQGNPSSMHSEGQKSRKQIDAARKVCANLLNTKPEQLVFTSGGTESNGIILSSLLRKKSKGRIILSAIEHPSIYEYSASLKDSGFDVVYIRPDSKGFIKPEDLKPLLTSNTIFIAIMTVNNETGAVQPLAKLVSVIREFEGKNGRNIHIHTDAVQTLGKMSFMPVLYDIDSASFSAHKIGGPKGMGLVFLKKSFTVLSPGGGQEFAQRPGTENTAGIIAFARAMEISMKKLKNNLTHAESLKALLNAKLSKIEGLKVLFSSKNDNTLLYSPYITSATVSPVPGEVIVRVLSDEGFQISTGSACSSRNRKKQTRVLTASGISERNAEGSIRISTGWLTTEADIVDFCLTLETKLSDLRRYLK